MRALDSNSKKPSTSTVSPVPKTAKDGGLGVQGSRPHDVLRARDSLNTTQPGDKHEREADKAADTVMSNRPASLNTNQAAPNSSSPSPTRAGASGAPLEPNTRTLMETRFSHDFSQVRVHTDEKAARSARDVNARAYTVGNDIVFGKGQYQPSTNSSQRLIAHELAHVVQQRNTGRTTFARQLEPEEVGRTIKRADVERDIGVSYWEQKVMDVYAMSYGTDRLKKDPEERDAVLSVLWTKQPPLQFTTRQVVDVQIPARATKSSSKPLLYKFTFEPRDPAVPGSRPSVVVEFIAAGTASTAITPAKPPGSYSSGIHSYAMSDFPLAYADYFDAFPEEEKYLFHWIEKEAPASFSQLIKVRTTRKSKKAVTTRETSFFVEGQKNKKGVVSALTIRFMGTYQPAVQSVPTDYRAKDYADLMVERAQTKPDEVNNDTLGKVNLPAGISTEEAYAVKFYVTQYFGHYTETATGNKVGGTRNKEVDAIVLVPNKPIKVLYTFRFQANNDVDVERVNEIGTGEAKLDPNKFDVARAPEFADKAQDPKTFQTWLKTRYPQVAVAGATVEEMRTNLNAEAEAKADKPDWFKNYEIKILNAADAKKRLKGPHKYKEQQTVDLKEFKPAELRLLEVSLETMARKILDVVKYTRMVRQRVAIEIQPDKTFKENPKWGGFALTSGTNKTVIIFDSSSGDPQLFIGGRAGPGVLPTPAEVYTHELGHLVGSSAVQKKFEAFVAKHNIQPFTRYAKESVAEGKPKEFFAEAFQMYQMDPEWMLTNYPLLHAWFETLAKTGKPPVK